MTVQELLDLRDRLVNRFHQRRRLTRTGFTAVYDYAPTIRDPKTLVRVQYLNRYLSSKLFQDPRQWLESLFSFFACINTTAVAD